MSGSIRTKPEPVCPVCGVPMILRRPRAGETWNPFWGCSGYPHCTGTRDINSDGTPESDDNPNDDFDGYYPPMY